MPKANIIIALLSLKNVDTINFTQFSQTLGRRVRVLLR